MNILQDYEKLNFQLHQLIRGHEKCADVMPNDDKEKREQQKKFEKYQNMILEERDKLTACVTKNKDEFIQVIKEDQELMAPFSMQCSLEEVQRQQNLLPIGGMINETLS